MREKRNLGIFRTARLEPPAAFCRPTNPQNVKAQRSIRHYAVSTFSWQMETQAQRRKGTCSRSYSKLVAISRLELWSPSLSSCSCSHPFWLLACYCVLLWDPSCRKQHLQTLGGQLLPFSHVKFLSCILLEASSKIFKCIRLSQPQKWMMKQFNLPVSLVLHTK